MKAGGRRAAACAGRLPAIGLALVVALSSACPLSLASNPIDCDCLAPACVCYIQLGDEGKAVKAIVRRLVELGYLPKEQNNRYDERCEAAVKAFQQEQGLADTGTMDDETMTRLLWEKSVAQMDAEGAEELLYQVWVPTDGGKKHHVCPRCFGMYSPRKIARRNAVAIGMDARGKCRPGLVLQCLSCESGKH